jgi:hypothetical protein
LLQEVLTVAEGDSPFGQIVGGELQGDFIACQNAYAVPPEATCQMGQDNAVMFKLDTEQTAGEFLKNCAGNFDAIFFAHIPFEADRLVSRPAEKLSGRCDVGRLQAFRALGHLKFYSGAFIQRAVALRLDGGEVYEHVFSILPLYKTVALGCVEPLHCTFFFHLPRFLLLKECT